MTTADFGPAATLPMLRLRAELMRSVREFFDRRGYWEVDTPLLSAEIVVDAWLEPFACAWLPEPTQWQSTASSLRYLQTSPEFAMKRLLAAGAEAIYQFGKVFRNGETGHRHNPEFTMIEWYRVGDDHHAQMEVTEALVRTVITHARQRLTVSSRTARVDAVLAGPSFLRMSYDDAFAAATGVKPLTAGTSELHHLAERKQLTPPPGLDAEDRDGWLNWLLAELIEPHLGRDIPVFLCDYPASQAALAKTHRRDDGVEVAHRFELYIDGMEFCNGYHELTDAAILRERIIAQSALREAAGYRPLPRDSRLLDAMDVGLPESAGVALGFDRLMMFAVGADKIDDVIPFPFDRA
ncbi:MAG: EF-P lysine aminoacylase EpmA [Planctomycetaceae bacterium]|nr:EF-P lysine aminoacylase EpmA [Planctomycetaceae bacterium]